MDLRGLWRFIFAVYACEIPQNPASCFRVQALWVAPLAFLKRSVNENLKKLTGRE